MDADETITLEEAMRRAGAKHWSGHGMERLYLHMDKVAELIGLKVSRYRSGNISSATLAGAEISNSEAYRILDSTVYLQDDVLHVRTRARNEAAMVELLTAALLQLPGQ